MILTAFSPDIPVLKAAKQKLRRTGFTNASMKYPDEGSDHEYFLIIDLYSLEYYLSSESPSRPVYRLMAEWSSFFSTLYYRVTQYRMWIELNGILMRLDSMGYNDNDPKASIFGAANNVYVENDATYFRWPDNQRMIDYLIQKFFEYNNWMHQSYPVTVIPPGGTVSDQFIMHQPSLLQYEPYQDWLYYEDHYLDTLIYTKGEYGTIHENE